LAGGTNQRVWMHVLLYTGLRRGDAVGIGKQHVRDGVATPRTEKSQGEVEVNLPILPILKRTLDIGPTSDLAFISGERGTSLTKESFGNMFKDACRAAGIDTNGKAAHGLRKVDASHRCWRATVHELGEGGTTLYSGRKPETAGRARHGQACRDAE
jgi:integrase